MRKDSNKNNKNVLIAIGAMAGAATLATLAVKKAKDKAKEDVITFTYTDHGDKQVYFIGGGLASLAGAAYLVRDCNFKGENIHIIEGMHILGGSNDGAGDIVNGFVCRGGRMLNEETYENFWELFSTIPSIDSPGKTVTEEILNFDHLHPTHAQARLVDRYGIIQDVTSMGFNNDDRMALGKLMVTPEEKLDDMTIEDWFRHTPHFFQTNFWYMWQTTFAFQKWSSLFEFKRYMERMIFEFSRIETLEGVTRTPYNQYESVILPLKAYLDKFNVDFSINAKVTDLDFKPGEGITVTAIHLEGEEVINLNPGDVCIMTNGCMTDSATLGDFNTPAEYKPENPISGELWSKIARKKMGLGNPEPFFGRPDQTNWESFTVTCKGNKLLKLIEQFSGNIPGSGALMTFKDSNWLMSIVVAAQPHFKNQPMDTTIFWGYGLYTDKVGDYVKKPMRDCTGEEILIELLHHLHMEDKMEEIMDTVVNVIPCMMPYIDSQFQPRKMTDRPQVVPEGSTNFAMISQFVEIPEDMVFTEEYSVRAARMAIYTLFNVKHKKVIPVTQYKKDPRVLKDALKTSYR
ncbi:oleate hydratase [Clostridium septicum]|uniref:Oleate hydratase n=1 Tax=Clostridium septicum TaxID=1504 RepID=A0A9N7PME2_CLOSE|nr:oleate hydratase [Clostridium septicum]AYE34982.1 oleate hydratase [Clostridium septicum]MDU1314627.1 oleate hydratase [Clostridium septicum]QAS60375.1 oleate hydratase [Clostridium septicum]UEC20369.1 oleate hydratase [Clostridium septicum]USS01578.1 oleate hydratase [Clostridium septicum]